MASAENISVLLQRVARQDRAAFAEVYRATSAKLYGIILRILRRRDIADEVLQEVYVKIWERAADFDSSLTREELAAKYGQPVNTIKTWLRRSLAQLKGCLGS